MDTAPRTVIVTGGSKGIGFKIAEGFVRSGANVVIAARDRASLDHAATQLDGSVHVVAGDVSDADFCEQMADAAIERFGRLDTLIANAGISPIYQKAQDIDPAVWRQILDVNVTGVFLASCAAAKRMEPGSSIVVTSSVLGARPMRRLAPYSVSKTAVDGLVKSLALDFADDGIRVNAVVPGWMDSAWTEPWQERPGFADRILSHTTMGRWGDVEELVGAYLFLASTEASFVTGASIAVDGGFLLK